MLEYRAKAYYGTFTGYSTMLCSGHTTLGHAYVILAGMLAIPGVSGGHLERHVQGIGWVLAEDDDSEVERRRIDHDTIYPHTSV